MENKPTTASDPLNCHRRFNYWINIADFNWQMELVCPSIPFKCLWVSRREKVINKSFYRLFPDFAPNGLYWWNCWFCLLFTSVRLPFHPSVTHEHDCRTKPRALLDRIEFTQDNCSQHTCQLNAREELIWGVCGVTFPFFSIRLSLYFMLSSNWNFKGS